MWSQETDAFPANVDGTPDPAVAQRGGDGVRCERAASGAGMPILPCTKRPPSTSAAARWPVKTCVVGNSAFVSACRYNGAEISSQEL